MGALCCNSDGTGRMGWVIHTPETVTTTRAPAVLKIQGTQMSGKIHPLYIVKYEMKVAKQRVELKSTYKLSLDEIHSG